MPSRALSRLPSVGALGLLALPLLALDAGCAVENPDHVEDSTGAETGWDCASGRCDTVRESFSAPVPACEGEDTELLVGAGGLALLCAVSRGPDGADVIHETTCRPLVCADELDCPQWTAREYLCLEGLCQSALALDPLDVTALCLADVPRHASCADADADPLVGERRALADEACPEAPCASPPLPCRQP